jgi:sterol desaturase/sphingolipid hydroxylase (fatty acid hydroxylase superfamily)
MRVMSWLGTFGDGLGAVLAYIGAISRGVFVSPGGDYGVATLLAALLVAAGYLILRRPSRRRQVPLKVLFRALFPRRIWRHPSTHTDIQYLLFNTFLFGLLFSWAVVSGHFVATGVRGGLSGALGEPSPSALPAFVQMALMTLVLFLAYELAYWCDHYLAHRVPFLWEFHKVHHSAELLSPLTNVRVHPVDTIVFYNIVALVMGMAGGLMQYVLGAPVKQFTFWSNNAIALLFAYSLHHLQHSHIWIAFPGMLGRVVLSPAHHQIHHSTNPIHFNKNLGSSVAIFDWLFGTLHLPQKRREKLTFGVDGYEGNPHSLVESLVQPVPQALAQLTPAPRDAVANGAPKA